LVGQDRQLDLRLSTFKINPKVDVRRFDVGG
jgi:hypothetical protein